MIASTEDRLTNYANWLTANKDRKGQPEFQKVAEAYKALRSAPVRQDKTVFASPDPGAPAFGQPVPDMQIFLKIILLNLNLYIKELNIMKIVNNLRTNV